MNRKLAGILVCLLGGVLASLGIKITLFSDLDTYLEREKGLLEKAAIMTPSPPDWRRGTGERRAIPRSGSVSRE